MVFFKSLICCALLVGIASAYPQRRSVIIKRAAAAAPAFNAKSQDIVVTAYDNKIDPATGAFEYGYQQNDGVAVSAKGHLNPNGAQVIEGSYTYVDAAGVPTLIQYVSDENGYQAVGDAIPKMDPIIAKAVAYLRTLPPSPEEKKQ